MTQAKPNGFAEVSYSNLDSVHSVRPCSKRPRRFAKLYILAVSSLEVFEFDARAMPGAKLAHRPNSIPMIGAMPYTENTNPCSGE